MDTHHDPKIQIYVKNISGRNVSYEISKKSTISQLKEEIYDKEGIPPQSQALFSHRLLDDSESLVDFELYNGMTFSLHLLLNGGSSSCPICQGKKENSQFDFCGSCNKKKSRVLSFYLLRELIEDVIKRGGNISVDEDFIVKKLVERYPVYFEDIQDQLIQMSEFKSILEEKGIVTSGIISNSTSEKNSQKMSTNLTNKKLHYLLNEHFVPGNSTDTEKDFPIFANVLFDECELLRGVYPNKSTFQNAIKYLLSPLTRKFSTLLKKNQKIENNVSPKKRKLDAEEDSTGMDLGSSDFMQDEHDGNLEHAGHFERDGHLASDQIRQDGDVVGELFSGTNFGPSNLVVQRESLNPQISKNDPKKATTAVLKFPTEIYQRKVWTGEEEERMLVICHFLGIFCEKSPNQLTNQTEAKKRIKSILVNFISLFFKSDYQLFFQSIFSTCEEECRKQFEYFYNFFHLSNSEKVSMTKLKQQKAEENRNNKLLFSELMDNIDASSNVKDSIIDVVKQFVPKEIANIFVKTRTAKKKVEHKYFSPITRSILSTNFYPQSQEVPLMEDIHRPGLFKPFPSPSLMRRFPQTRSNQFPINQPLNSSNLSSFGTKIDLPQEWTSTQHKKEFLNKHKLNEQAESVLSFDILTPSEYITAEKKSVGVQCYLDDKGLKMKRGEENHFLLYQNIDHYLEINNVSKPVVKQKEQEHFELEKSFSLKVEDLSKGGEEIWRAKYDNVSFIGLLEEKVKKYFTSFLHMPVVLERDITSRTLLIASSTRLEYVLKKMTLNSQFSVISVEGNKFEIKKKEAAENFFVDVFQDSQVQLFTGDLNPTSVVYIHENNTKKKKKMTEKLRKSVPGITFVDSVHVEENVKKDGNQVYLKDGETPKKKKVVNKNLFEKISHIIVKDTKLIKFLAEQAKNRHINIVLSTLIDFFKLKRTYANHNNIVSHLCTNLSQNTNTNVPPMELNRKQTNIRMDNDEIFCQISFPSFELMNQLELIYPYINQTLLNSSETIRIGFTDHADHATNEVQVRCENITISYNPKIMDPKAKSVTNRYSCWGTFNAPDTKECTDKILNLKGNLFADTVSFPVTYNGKNFLFYWDKTTGDNKDQCGCMNKTKKCMRCPNCNFNYTVNSTNHSFFSFKNNSKCERNTLGTCLRKFNEILSKGGTLSDAEEAVCDLGYMNSPSPLVISFFLRMKQIYSTEIVTKVMELTLQILENVIILTDILHDGQGMTRTLFQALVEQGCFQETVFERLCVDLTCKNSKNFMGGHYRKLLINFELLTNPDSKYYAFNESLNQETISLLTQVLATWREVFWMSYQSTVQPLEYFQFYFETLVFYLSTLLQHLDDDFNIRKTYSHGPFHYPDIWRITDLVNGCSEIGENVNYRIGRATSTSNHLTQNIFQRFKKNEVNDQENKPTKIQKIQNELRLFITKNKHQFRDLELTFGSNNVDFLAFKEVIESYHEDCFEIKEIDGKFLFTTKVADKINQYLSNHFF